jgi:hypothetical protein
MSHLPLNLEEESRALEPEDIEDPTVEEDF